MLFAEREIFLVVSRLLWAFNMEESEGRRTDLNKYDGLSARRFHSICYETDAKVREFVGGAAESGLRRTGWNACGTDGKLKRLS
jgi:hypothetical protein